MKLYEALIKLRETPSFQNAIYFPDFDYTIGNFIYWTGESFISMVSPLENGTDTEEVMLVAENFLDLDAEIRDIESLLEEFIKDKLEITAARIAREREGDYTKWFSPKEDDLKEARAIAEVWEKNFYSNIENIKRDLEGNNE